MAGPALKKGNHRHRCIAVSLGRLRPDRAVELHAQTDSNPPRPARRDREPDDALKRAALPAAWPVFTACIAESVHSATVLGMEIDNRGTSIELSEKLSVFFQILPEQNRNTELVYMTVQPLCRPNTVKIGLRPPSSQSVLNPTPTFYTTASKCEQSTTFANTSSYSANKRHSPASFLDALSKMA